MFHSGLTHVGLGIGLSSRSVCIRCVGDIIEKRHHIYSVRAAMAFIKQNGYVLAGFIYSPTTRLFYRAKGISCELETKVARVQGVIRRTMTTTYRVTGSWATKMSTVIIAKGDKIFPFDSTYRCMAKTRIRDKMIWNSIGNLHGACRQVLLTVGRLAGAKRQAYKTVGRIVNGTRLMYSVKAVSHVAKHNVYKVIGDLASNNRAMFYLVKGAVSTIAYVCSVPTKFQEFITAKRWFKSD